MLRRGGRPGAPAGRVLALQAQLPRAACQLVFSGLLDFQNLKVQPFWGQTAPGYKGGLGLRDGAGFRAKRWAMVAVWVTNPSDRPAWTLDSARLTSVKGERIQVHSVHMDPPQLPPGGSALVVVMVEPHTTPEKLFRLDLMDARGEQILPIVEVKL